MWKSSLTGHPRVVTNLSGTDTPVGNQSNQVVEINHAVFREIPKAIILRKTLEVSAFATDHRPQSARLATAGDGGGNTDLSNATRSQERITVTCLTTLVRNTIEIAVLAGEILQVTSVRDAVLIAIQRGLAIIRNAIRIAISLTRIGHPVEITIRITFVRNVVPITVVAETFDDVALVGIPVQIAIEQILAAVGNRIQIAIATCFATIRNAVSIAITFAVVRRAIAITIRITFVGDAVVVTILTDAFFNVTIIRNAVQIAICRRRARIGCTRFT